MKPGEGGYEDCNTLSEVQAKIECSEHRIGIALFVCLAAGMWMFQHALYTLCGIDIPLCWDFVGALFCRRYVGQMFGLSLVWRACYGDVFINAATWNAMLEIVKGGAS